MKHIEGCISNKKILLLSLLVSFLIVGCAKEKKDVEPPAKPDTEETYDDWVDLGLPSGLLWATRNVGATTPADYGDYYAWGETSPKETYDTVNCRYYDEGSSEFTKYNSGDGLTTLQADDDAATANYGGRMPTDDEWKELYDNTTSQWMKMKGVYGRRFTGANGNSLFLPAAGWRYGTSVGGNGFYGYYWSASRCDNCRYNAWQLNFNSVDVQYRYGTHRYRGHSVRAVRTAR